MLRICEFANGLRSYAGADLHGYLGRHMKEAFVLS